MHFPHRFVFSYQPTMSQLTFWVHSLCFTVTCLLLMVHLQVHGRRPHLLAVQFAKKTFRSSASLQVNYIWNDTCNILDFGSDIIAQMFDCFFLDEFSFICDIDVERGVQTFVLLNVQSLSLMAFCASFAAARSNTSKRAALHVWLLPQDICPENAPCAPYAHSHRWVNKLHLIGGIFCATVIGVQARNHLAAKLAGNASTSLTILTSILLYTKVCAIIPAHIAQKKFTLRGNLKKHMLRCHSNCASVTSDVNVHDPAHFEEEEDEDDEGQPTLPLTTKLD